MPKQTTAATNSRINAMLRPVLSPPAGFWPAGPGRTMTGHDDHGNHAGCDVRFDEDVWCDMD